MPRAGEGLAVPMVLKPCSAEAGGLLFVEQLSAAFIATSNYNKVIAILRPLPSSCPCARSRPAHGLPMACPLPAHGLLMPILHSLSLLTCLALCVPTT
jgi:hypothetical protein